MSCHKSIMVGSMVAASMMCGNFSDAKSKAPNVILFYVDDLGWMDLSCQGSTFYETPAIDKMASEGVRFTNGYTAHPRCLPARYGVMTGKFPSRAGIPGRGSLAPEDYTIGEAMRDGGYSTYYIGKWHLIGKYGEKNHPHNQGFDTALACGAPGAPQTYFYPYRKKGADQPLTGDAAKGLDHGIIPDLDEGGKKGEYLTDRITDETIAYIKAQQKATPDKPFFAGVFHYGVHTPIEAPEHLVKKYEKKLAKMQFKGPELIQENGSDTKARQDHPVYAAMIESVDQSLGRINDTLKELGIDDNTVIIFTADNGGLSNRGPGNQRELATSNLPLRTGKGWAYEGGIREAFIVKWPKVIKPGRVTDDVVVGTDIYPTVLDIAGIEKRPEAHIDGVSFIDSLKGKKYTRSKPIFWYGPRPRRESTGDTAYGAVRHGNFKLIDWSDLKTVELYDLCKDKEEKNNLAEAMPEKTKELMDLLAAYKKEIRAVKPQPFGKKKSGKKSKKGGNNHH